MEKTFSITNATKGRLPRLPFSEMKKAVLGASYTLSLVFINDTSAQRFNQVYRKKSTPANVLAFPLADDEGEICINTSRAKREAPEYGLTYRNHLAFLFIHGLLHLKGERHGSTMEKEERKYMRRFGLM
ncbi:MAG: rRNA maturation RNase YbeY [Parcubacteria group bacterium]|nr:rRNA maturation RNase YbeY [Parcubacteria group bacterium]